MSEGLQFVLDFAPDTNKVKAALADIGKIASAGIILGARASRDYIPPAISGGWRGISTAMNAAGSQNPLGLGFTAAEAGIGKMSQLLGMIPEVGPALGAATAQLAIVPGELHAITDSLIAFSAVASPGQYRAYQMALEDLQGTIGQTFLPVLGLMRDGVRLTADVLATVLPSSGEAEQALLEFRTIFDAFSADVRQAVGAVGPQLRGEFVNMLKSIAEAIKTNMPSGKQVAEFVSGLVKLTSWLVTATKWLAQAF
ncbi:MAG: hypothetical protein KGL39_25610, partial [Patescibacteria group bacterium]|nr:hypothetical protein [Patescibacteria group bacterium]